MSDDLVPATTLADRYRAVRARIDAACVAARRAPADVTLVAVSKTHPAAAIREAIAAGAADFGENYAQELADKQRELPFIGASVGAGVGAGVAPAGASAAMPRWHFIGRLQRNKAKLVAGRVALVHAVDSVELGVEIGKRAGGVVQPVLLAVNLGGEASKSGVTAADALACARGLAAAAGVRLDGLMTLPPPSDDPEASRPVFRALAQLRDELAAALGAPLPVLSMGMSDDFEVAIACGATHVRIGTAIFGARPRDLG